MSVTEQLRDAGSALEQAIDGSPPPLMRPQALFGPGLVVGSLIVLGGGLLALQSWEGGSSPTPLVEIEASGTDHAVDDSSSATTELDFEDPAPGASGTGEVQSEPPLHVLADNPAGWSLQQAVVLDPPSAYADAAGAVDLLIRPTTWLPIGYSTSLEVSVQQALYRNPADAETLTVRGRDATLLDDGYSMTLTWVEGSNVHVVVTSYGYDRQQVLAVVDGLRVDHESLTASAGQIPEGSTATPSKELTSPGVSLVYRHEDGSEASVYAVQTGRIPTEADRALLRTQADSGDFSIIERPEGIGVSFLAHAVDPVINWWTEDGLYLILQSKTGDISDLALADLAASIVPVDEAAWNLAGGQ